MFYIYCFLSTHVNFFIHFEVSMEFNDIGESIVKLRKDKNISQLLLAESIGVSRATINAIEKGRSGDIGIKKVMKILAYFGYELTIKPCARFPTFEELQNEQ